MDFLAVGDIVTDAFIRLKDASVHCSINNDSCEICMRWGDKIPYESATVVPAVGNASNAAVAAARLGLKSALRAYVGADQQGQECLASLLKDGVDATFVERVEGKPTNYHYVLWYENQRTILVKHTEFEYRVPPLPSGPTWLYLSSLAQNSLPYHHALVQQLSRWSNTKLAFQPGTFQFTLGKEALADIYKRSDIFFCNKEEAERVLGVAAGADIKELLQQIQALGPKTVVITDDIRGAYALDAAGATLFCPRWPDPREPFEKTGAGDAFASTTTVALSLGKTLEQALAWGAVNASSVVQDIGAQRGLLTRAQLEQQLATPPAPFAVEAF